MNTASPIPQEQRKPAIGNLFGIVPQTQPDGKTCVQTCLAMALGVPVEKVIAQFGGEAMNQISLTKALTECGFVWNQMIVGTMVYEGWYFAAVPSLNHRGGMHEILMRHTQDDGWLLIDPANGEKYKQDGSDLKSWADLTPFWLGGLLPNLK